LIITLTINPALDHNHTVDRLVFEDRAYIQSKTESAGGRGINASSVIHAFGGRTKAIATAGGENGMKLEEYLSCYGFPFELVKIKNEIRSNLTITDRQGLTIKLNEPGPPIDNTDLERLERSVKDSLDGADWLMICGSVPPGVPPQFYGTLVELGRTQGVKTLVDADGAALRNALDARPTVVAPNQSEAERLLDTVLITRSQSMAAAEKIRAMGAESVILSLGSRGAVGAADAQVFEAVPPRIDAVCPIGAGDALAAAFTWAMKETGDFADAVRWGVAAGTASAKLPGLKFASLDQAREVYSAVEIRRTR
jgi:1-phosphofructokinase family hexose kinase